MYQYESGPKNCLWLTTGSICSQKFWILMHVVHKALIPTFDSPFSAGLIFQCVIHYSHASSPVYVGYSVPIPNLQIIQIHH